MLKLVRNPAGYEFSHHSTTKTPYSMKYLWILFWMGFGAMVFGQEHYLEITNPDTQEIKVFKQKDRVRVVTSKPNRKRLTGRITFIDNQTIKLRKDTIALSDVVKIKPAPLGYSIFSSFITFGLGSIPFVGVALLGYSGDTAANIAGAAIGIPLFFYLFKSLFVAPNILKGYKTKDGWVYAIKES